MDATVTAGIFLMSTGAARVAEGPDMYPSMTAIWDVSSAIFLRSAAFFDARRGGGVSTLINKLYFIQGEACLLQSVYLVDVGHLIHRVIAIAVFTVHESRGQQPLLLVKPQGFNCNMIHLCEHADFVQLRC